MHITQDGSKALIHSLTRQTTYLASMKKIVPVILALFLFESLGMEISAQRSKKNEQLYLMSAELLKSDKASSK